MPVNLLLVGSTDRHVEDALRACGGHLRTAGVAELSALAQPGARQPDILVVDLRDQTALPGALPSLKRQHPNTGVIIVASRLEPALLLEAMRSGVNEVVSDPLSQAELEAAIARLMAHRSTPEAAGLAFAFLGAKGGVGTTTIAVNVATALAALAPQGTLLIDLHLSNGHAALFLGAEPRFSIVDALENTHRLDEQFFRSLVVKTKSGVDLLASSERVMLAPVDVRHVRTLIEFAARQYKYVVLDLAVTDSAMLDSLEPVSRIVVVSNQELATVRSTSRIASALRQRYGKDKLTIVVSRSDRLAEIGYDDVERAVGSPVKHVIPSDYRRALQALNRGRPLTLDNHNELAGTFVRFARSLAGLDSPAAPARGSGRFSLFGTR